MVFRQEQEEKPQDSDSPDEALGLEIIFARFLLWAHEPRLCPAVCDGSQLCQQLQAVFIP